MDSNNLSSQTPKMNWETKDLPSAFKAFKTHAEFMFGGPLKKKSEAEKCNYLMLWSGDHGRQLYSTWKISDEEKNSLDTYFNNFEQYCQPKSNRIYARYRFRSRTQQEGEMFEQYVTDLKVLLRDCGYPVEMNEDLVRDQIVFGIRSQKIREKLINEGSDLTLQKTLDIARTVEMSQVQCQSMTKQDIGAVKLKTKAQQPKPFWRKKEAASSNPHVRNPKGNQSHQMSKQCGNCGRKSHAKGTVCPAYGQICLSCRKPNHFAKVCRSKRNISELQVSGLLPDLENNFIVDTISLDQTQNQAFITIEVGPKYKDVEFKLDTGSHVNIIPRSIWNCLGIHDPLRPTDRKLTAYDGTYLKVDGQANLKVRHKDTAVVSLEEFYVVNTSSTPLLGLKTCISMNLIMINVDNLDMALNKEDVLSRYPDIFQGIGQLPGECEIHLKQDAIPVIHPPRRVPVAVHDKLKAELQMMLEKRVIQKVSEPTEWVNSLVTVEKGNGKLRICLDPKDLNNAIKRPHYPSKTLDEILPDLAGSSVFSKLDARSGYWSIKLTEKSFYLTTFNSPFGRFRFLRLPFGLLCSQDMFQQKMDECLEGLQGIKTIVDDIVVFGKDRAEHDRNFDRLMTRCSEKGIRLNPEKMEIGKSQISFFGHLLTSDGLKMDPSKVRAIKEMPPPTCKSELETVLGMVTHFTEILSKSCRVN
ncbi:uncharacterized protein K02A2.6-like [Mercenaria mercenaria]|uniref:uncharacterized protein K02A2.6-like n=1 Tax=Mercenaria mercenaria TaxID=6596 RepID=UPI00234FA379|nr:uncharacterized protein K02A2.6-like [Mercenaria mercenaria]